MSHKQQLAFIKLALEEVISLGLPIESVLEVGSYDVNGSVRGLINAKDYLGIDLVEGPGVDLVYDGLNLEIKKSYDLGISSECFEHDPNWKNTFSNMIKYAKRDGVIIFTCASWGRLEHGTSRTDPNHSPGTSYRKLDHYKNLNMSDFVEAFELSDFFSDFYFHNEASSCDLFFVGFLRGDEDITFDDKDKFDSKLKALMFNIKNENASKESGPLTNLSFLDWPIRKGLLLLPSENLYQDYYVLRRRLVDYIGALFK